MKGLFFSYSFLYLAIALIMSFSQVTPMQSKLLFCLAILIMGLVLIAPLLVIMYPKLIKPHKSDPVYMNYCLATGIFRIVFLSLGVFGLRDHLTLLMLNSTCVLLYVLFIDRFIKKTPLDYFKY